MPAFVQCSKHSIFRIKRVCLEDTPLILAYRSLYIKPNALYPSPVQHMADSHPRQSHETRPLSDPFATPVEPLFPSDITSSWEDSLSSRTSSSRHRHRKRSKSRARSDKSTRTVEYYSLDSQGSVYSSSVYSSSVCSSSSTIIARPSSPIKKKRDTDRSPYGSSGCSTFGSKSTPQLSLPRKTTVCVTPTCIGIDTSRVRKVTVETLQGERIQIINDERRSRKCASSSSRQGHKHQAPTSRHGSSTTGKASDYARQAFEHSRHRRDHSEHRHAHKKDASSSLQVYIASSHQQQIIRHASETRTDSYSSPLRRAISVEELSSDLLGDGAMVRPARKSVNPLPQAGTSGLGERDSLPVEPEFVDSRGKPLHSCWSEYSKDDDPKSEPAEVPKAKGGTFIERLKGFTKKL